MRKKIIYFGIVAVILLSVFGLKAYTNKNEYKYARERIEDLTEIEIPIDSEIVYHSLDDAAFKNGRRAQYTVFKFESEPTNWLKENIFSEGRDEDFEIYFMSSLDFLPVKIEEITDKFFPKFEKEYLWIRTNSGVYFFYDIKNFILIVSIAGH